MKSQETEPSAHHKQGPLCSHSEFYKLLRRRTGVRTPHRFLPCEQKEGGRRMKMHKEDEGLSSATSPTCNILSKILPIYSLWISSQLFLTYTSHAGRCFQCFLLDSSCSSQQLNSKVLKKETLTVALIPGMLRKSDLLLSQETKMMAAEKLKAEEMLAMKDRVSLELKLGNMNFYPWKWAHQKS